ncbi:beta-ketoacyl-ACP synthase [Marinomonas posidonica]|uniref:Beta-ketoacyl-acyl-carrier-protein synthase I n=1 Tax=Marinomonas posidonica (strain CECT 7376 / NCIMB 14433 / IVIA-Po-181) TaxID=491952 RepID=F6CZU7_MARPP|nr:beta-ketoacyl-ACP synthase [Marinomonas posidonica]AEF53608.1 Beta-ketoacyl-acyl-carrier-protein synthase I [Marinomonas posidonica IVIA-Po-181]
MKQCYLNAMGMISALGDGTDITLKQLQYGQPQLTYSNAYHNGPPLPLGLIQQSLNTLPLHDKKWKSRNNQLTWHIAQQFQPEIEAAIAKFGADRIGVVIGTSTSGIAESESHMRTMANIGTMPEEYHYHLQEMGAPADFLAQTFGISGPTFGISTACSSGAKALASARRLIRAGICDVVIAGGVDTICRLTVQGFSSLEAVSTEPCNPFSSNRNGINIGEGGALFLVSAEASDIALTGIGESSDAHHISAPDPSGLGAIRSMSNALDDAGITATAIDYINLHGTATPLNDQMESIAVNELFSKNTLCSSTKPYTGHTLGAAGALEAAICVLALRQNFQPEHIWDGSNDQELPILNFAPASSYHPMRFALSNSFAFGGNNITLILERIS